MLRKLIGYEFRATRRIYLPFYGAMLILAILNTIFMSLPTGISDRFQAPLVLTMTLYSMAMAAVCALSFGYMIYRFYKNLLGDEGYLMFTLPASPAKLIWAKAITATIWMLLTAIVSVLTAMLYAVPMFFAGNGSAWTTFIQGFQGLGQVFGQAFQYYGANLFAYPIEFIVLGIVVLLNLCMHIYACLAIGGLFNRHRLLAAFGAYVGFGILKQIAVIIGGNVVSKLPFDFDVSSYPMSVQVHVFCLSAIALFAVCLAVNFLITNYILKKHLNLQ